MPTGLCRGQRLLCRAYPALGKEPCSSCVTVRCIFDTVNIHAGATTSLSSQGQKRTIHAACTSWGCIYVKPNTTASEQLERIKAQLGVLLSHKLHCNKTLHATDKLHRPKLQTRLRFASLPCGPNLVKQLSIIRASDVKLKPAY